MEALEFLGRHLPKDASAPTVNDPYSILGLRRGDRAGVRKAYLRLALKLHPDKNRGENSAKAGEAFKIVAAAYEELKR